MGQTSPYKRTCRQFVDDRYAEGGRAQYIYHPDFSQDPQHYVRAFQILQKDLLELFDFIEPTDSNLASYSFRIHALFMRVCIEVEANCTAILRENGYIKSKGELNMADYQKLEASHFLSYIKVRFPVWDGGSSIRSPYAAWTSGISLPWYQAYNSSKHDRHINFKRATFQNLTEAFAGLVAILAAQFYTFDFSPSGGALMVESGYGAPPGFETAIGNYFQVLMPTNIPSADRYDFDWSTLKTTASPIRMLVF